MIRPRMIAAIVCLLLSLLTSGAEAASAPSAVITVDAGRTLGPVQPLVFGHNVEAGDTYGTGGVAYLIHNYSLSRTGDGLWNPDTAAPVREIMSTCNKMGVKMLRYPGGCLAHYFDWHDAVGPASERPNFAFGIDEFMTVCKTLGAEPLMTVSDYTGAPRDAADLVEYLNAPADARHPWAQKRAKWGHPRPYHVRYFEMGNESEYGNHIITPHKQYSAVQYAKWFNECARRMRAIDPTIKIGVQIGNAPWDTTVLKQTRGNADYVIIHIYVDLVDNNKYVWASTARQHDLMQACMAAGEQFEAMLSDNRRLVRKYAGKDLPLAMTEYNGAFAPANPIPYRYSFGSALFCADYIRILLQPKSNVLMANYWQLINGYWGMIHTDPAKPKLMPAYYLYRLWGQHFGTRLVNVSVESPRIELHSKVCRVFEASGDKFVPEKTSKANLLDGRTLNGSHGPGYVTEAHADGTLVAKLDHLAKEEYPSFVELAPLAKGGSYVLSFEARASGNVSGSRLGLGMGDIRGWDAKHSAMGLDGIELATDWQEFKGSFEPLEDSPGTQVLWRLQVSSEHPAVGTIQVRKLRIESYQPPKFPAYAALTACASRSANSKKIYLIVFNKHLTDDIPARIVLRQTKNAASVRRWTVTGPIDGTNQVSEEVRETESGVAMQLPRNGILTYVFPARSMTAIEFASR